MPRFRNLDDLNTRSQAGGTTRGIPATAWNGIVHRNLSAFPQSPTPATSARGGSVRCRWCAIAAPITPSPHGSAIARCWSAAMSRGGHQFAAEVIPQPGTSKRTSSSTALSVRWSKRPTRRIRRLPWPALCRRCSAISAAYLKRGWAKPGSGIRQVRRSRASPSTMFEHHIGGLERGVIGFDSSTWCCAGSRSPPRLNLQAIPICRRRGGNTLARSYMGLLKGARHERYATALARPII